LPPRDWPTGEAESVTGPGGGSLSVIEDAEKLCLCAIAAHPPTETASAAARTTAFTLVIIIVIVLSLLAALRFTDPSIVRSTAATAV
jgi:hypothetical protein